ncbi:DUF58 domain-containing protein [Adhaeretor mobilis]|uniref:DUF58 domain-containing protein n=1 Tax=Adhaeretor mobilis TaxID=1930276 RepID=A0A517MXM9_9BACT|nr:DUF58 domain-containing protein [Adhaeretor mobilis]QDS99619.1 hypothetical protein HG15A2_29450 [Adhaeretor mobilis]
MLTDGQSREFLEPTVLARLASVPMFARRAMQGSVSGRHPSPHRGASVEFAEYRKYVPGDDLRRLHWRALGRTGRYYVKEFEADTNLRLCLVLDTSGSMAFGSASGAEGMTKIDYARRLAGSLGYLAVQQGDAVGLTCVAGGIVKDIPPRRNPAHLMHVFDTLEETVPEGDTQLVPVLHELAETIRQRALIVVISDLFVEPSELRECFEHLRFRRHDLAAFHLLDPQELSFQFRRPVRFQDMEGGTSIFAEPTEIADRYHKALRQYQDDLRQIVLETGVDYHEVRIDEDYEQVLMRFLIRRTQMRGKR